MEIPKNNELLMLGDSAKYTTGDGSTLTGGNCSTLTGRYYSTLTGGNCSTLTGGNYSTLTGGYYSTLTGGYYSTLTWRIWDGSHYRLHTFYTGENGIKPNTPYKLEDGKIVEVAAEAINALNAMLEQAADLKAQLTKETP